VKRLERSPKDKPLTPLRTALYGHFRALFLQGQRENMRFRQTKDLELVYPVRNHSLEAKLGLKK